MNSRTVGGIVILFTVLLNLLRCDDKKSNSNSVLTYLNHSDSARYVGMQVCGTCHADKLETFIHTGMGLSFDSATQSKSKAHFGSMSLVYDSVLDYFYYPYWKSDQFFIDEFRLQNGDTIHKRSERIDYIVGSGQHTNSHLLYRNGYLFQAPITFYTQKQKWDLAPGFEHGNNSRFTRIIDDECMGCHNSMPVLSPTDERNFQRIGRGIDCERCHGPGSVHVNKRLSGASSMEGVDRTIVNPSDLSWERQIDLCQRCHLQGNNVLKPGKRFEDFRPGMVLKDVFEVYLPEYDGAQSGFKMANHSDRLQMSACFKSSNQPGKPLRLTCITCHNPHVSVRETRMSVFNSTCINCHHSNCTEREYERLKVQNSCVTCHMPGSSAEDIPHVSVHDHKIGIFKEAIQNVRMDKDPIGLYCVNNPDPEPEMLIRAYLTYYEKFDALPLYRKKARELLDHNPVPALEAHYAYQVGHWQEVINYAGVLNISEIGHTDAYRVAEAFAARGNYSESAEWFELALQKAPDRFEYLNRYANVLTKLRRYEEAIQTLSKVIKLNPVYKPALSNMAYVMMESGQTGKAAFWLDRCLKIDPDFIPALENSIRLSLIKGDRNRTLEHLEKLQRLDPNNIRAAEVLKELKQQP